MGDMTVLSLSPMCRTREGCPDVPFLPMISELRGYVHVDSNSKSSNTEKLPNVVHADGWQAWLLGINMVSLSHACVAQHRP